MAVFVITSQTRQRALAKASIRYFAHRRDKGQEKLTRTLYARHGISNKYEAYRAIDNAADEATFFRLVLNFDPVSEDTNRDLDLRKITEKTMREVERRLKTQRTLYFAAIHDNQKGTDLRHVHILAILNGRFRPSDLAALHKAVTKHTASQRREFDGQIKEPEPATPWLRHKQDLSILFERPLGYPQQRKAQSASGGRPQNPTCATCGPGHLMDRLTRTLFHCVGCGSITKDTGRTLEILRSPQLEISLGKEAGTL